jgi:ribosomal protein S18 acetylase RimI-like enzyme
LTAGRRRQKNEEPARSYFPRMLKIRRYQPDDNQTVKELHYAGITQMVELIPEEERLIPPPNDEHFIDSDLDDIEGAYINSRGDFLVGLEDGEMVVIGAIRQATDTCGELKRLRVRRDRQRHGYGEAMMLRLIERAKELGYQELFLDTLESNLPAQRLFEELGFNELRRERKGPAKLIIYRKKLNEEGK